MPQFRQTRVIPGGWLSCSRVLFSLMLSPLFAIAKSESEPVAEVDLSAFYESSGFGAAVENSKLKLSWPISPTESGLLQLNLESAPRTPLISILGVIDKGKTHEILTGVDPILTLTVGSRTLKEPAWWMRFFDSPAERSHLKSPMRINKTSIRVTTTGSRMKVVISEVSAPPFRGNFEFTLYQNSALVFAEAVMETAQNGCAILYDAGITTSTHRVDLLTRQPNWDTMAWLDAKDGEIRRAPVDLNHVVAPLTVARRAIVAESSAGSVALFPPPHQYFAPSDFASNLGYVWQGRSGNLEFSGYGFGIQQSPMGDRRFAPWCNAPPHTQQRMGIFYIVSSGDAGDALDEVSRYTHQDRYRPLPGHVTFSSHFHMEHTLNLVAQRESEGNPLAISEELLNPGFLTAFKARGVQVVHLAEFHVWGMQSTPLERRLPLLKTMFEECERLSDDELLILPGEEPNVHLGGHWMSLFPKPVYWILNRPSGAPFVSNIPGYGKVYQVGNTDDVLRLMELEEGLMWTAHPRIKGSRNFPDQYFDQDFYQSDRFLGAAWKSMPVDLSLPRLGKRVLDLQDDMANRGARKYILGEADLFGIEPEMETYAHFNINYLRLDRVPQFTEGWQPVLDALRGGEFFVSTGEVLIPEFLINDQASGGCAILAEDGQARIRIGMEWTFPLSFAEIVSGDGRKIYRHRINLDDTLGFGARELDFLLDLKDRNWARLEVWDIARNGAFTPPIWLESAD